MNTRPLNPRPLHSPRALLAAAALFAGTPFVLAQAPEPAPAHPADAASVPAVVVDPSGRRPQSTEPTVARLQERPAGSDHPLHRRVHRQGRDAPAGCPRPPHHDHQRPADRPLQGPQPRLPRAPADRHRRRRDPRPGHPPRHRRDHPPGRPRPGPRDLDPRTAPTSAPSSKRSSASNTPPPRTSARSSRTPSPISPSSTSIPSPTRSS